MSFGFFWKKGGYLHTLGHGMRVELQICELSDGAVYVAIFEHHVVCGYENEDHILHLYVTKAFDSLAELVPAVDAIRKAMRSKNFFEIRKFLAAEVPDLEMEKGWSAWDCGKVIAFYHERMDLPHIFAQSPASADDAQAVYMHMMDMYDNPGDYGIGVADRVGE